MKDITIIFYTANVISEGFAAAIREQLVIAACGIPIISVSQKPMPNFGQNICVGDIGRSHVNIYKQALIGAQAATTTSYVAMCEDDVLYHPSHFTCHRPVTFAYNMNKWTVHTWDKHPRFSQKHRAVFSQCIAPREMLIQNLTERFSKNLSEHDLKIHFAEPGRFHDSYLGITSTKEEFFSSHPNIVFFHVDAMAMTEGPGKKHAHVGEIAESVEPWGAARDVLLKYVGEEEIARQKGTP
jgi:hypothetical protein